MPTGEPDDQHTAHQRPGTARRRRVAELADRQRLRTGIWFDTAGRICQHCPACHATVSIPDPPGSPTTPTTATTPSVVETPARRRRLRPPAPRSVPHPGACPMTPTPRLPTPMPVTDVLDDQISTRLRSADYRDWRAQVEATRGCAAPIHLRGSSRILDRDGAVLLERSRDRARPVRQPPRHRCARPARTATAPTPSTCCAPAWRATTPRTSPPPWPSTRGRSSP